MALVVAVLAALVAAGIAAAVSSTVPVKYAAAAQFNVIARSADIDAISVSRAIMAEQVLRHLEDGRADEYAAAAAPEDEYTAEWVSGPRLRRDLVQGRLRRSRGREGRRAGSLRQRRLPRLRTPAPATRHRPFWTSSR